jgi:uncharacterized protein YdaU (DUF1376 family)
LNFYKHHLGDYSAATSHLTWDEDCAYRRLLDTYYKREAPIPVEISEACRLTRASTPAQRKAVETVLKEFFTLESDGWHQKRADEEVHDYKEQASTNRRIAQQRETTKRARVVHEPSTLTTAEREPNQNQNQEPEPVERALRATRFALASVPDEWVNFCKQERPDLDPARTFAKFGDYWRGKGGQAGRKLDWLATWRNWVREERGATGRLPDAPKGSAAFKDWKPEVVAVAVKDDPAYKQLLSKMRAA